MSKSLPKIIAARFVIKEPQCILKSRSLSSKHLRNSLYYTFLKLIIFSDICQLHIYNGYDKKNETSLEIELFALSVN